MYALLCTGAAHRQKAVPSKADMVLVFAGLPKAGRVTSGLYAGTANGAPNNAKTTAEAGKKVAPAVMCFWRALCHAKSPEAIAEDVGHVTLDMFSYELVRQSRLILPYLYDLRPSLSHLFKTLSKHYSYVSENVLMIKSRLLL